MALLLKVGSSCNLLQTTSAALAALKAVLAAAVEYLFVKAVKHLFRLFALKKS